MSKQTKTRESAVGGGPPTAAGLRGKVEIDFARCTLSGACAEACPTRALRLDVDSAAKTAELVLDLGHCVFCGLCEEACAEGAVRMTAEIELATRSRHELVSHGIYGGGGGSKRSAGDIDADDRGGAAVQSKVGANLRTRLLDVLGRSLNVLHLDAGSCNGCEAELVAAASPLYELSRYGVMFVAAPMNADMLIVTGPVTGRLVPMLEATLAEMPTTRSVIALGACAIGGGIYRDTPAEPKGLDGSPLVDVWVPGCPPGPTAIIHAIGVALDRVEARVRAKRWQGPWPQATRPA